MKKLTVLIISAILFGVLIDPDFVRAAGVLDGTGYETIEVTRQYSHTVSGVIEEDPSCGYMISPTQGYSMCLLYDQSQENMLESFLGSNITANGQVYVLGQTLASNDPALRDEYSGVELFDIRPGRGELRPVGGGQPVRVAGGPWLFPDSDRRYLTGQDLAPLNKSQLWRARNEIYARRGYIFKSPRGQALAASLGGYYQGITDNAVSVESTFNRYEQKNVIMIKKWEKGAGGQKSGYSTFSSSPWLFPDSDRRFLTEGDLSGLSRAQLWQARNEIYARRGYIFSTNRGREYARSLGSTYIAREADIGRVANSLNKYERYNVKFIKDHE